MQSAGRAVTPSPASLYTSSRHALSRPARHGGEGACPHRNTASSQLDYTWNPASPIVFAAPNARCDLTWRSGAPIVFSRPDAQKRCSSSKPPRPKPKEMVYVGRQTSASKDQGTSNMLKSSYRPAFSGRSSSPPSPSADRVDFNDIGSFISDSSRRSSIAVAQRRSPPPPPPQSAPAPAHPVLPTADTSPFATEAQKISEHHNPDISAETSEQAESSILDEIEQLQQQYQELKEVMKQQQKDYNQLQKSHTNLQKSQTDLQNSYTALKQAHTEQIDRLNTQHTQARRLLQSKLDHEKDLVASHSSKLQEVERDLALERDPINRQLMRRAADRQFETSSLHRRKQQEAKDRRKLARKDYQAFRDFSHEMTAMTMSLFHKPDILPARVGWYDREIAYWNRALKALHSFQEETKAGDIAQFWDVGEQVQAKSLDQNEQEALRERATRQLELRLQHRDSIFSQIKAHVRKSSAKSDRERHDYILDFERITTQLNAVRSQQHEHRRLVRATRFDLVSEKTSPEMKAHERAITANLCDIDRPLANVLNQIDVRIEEWKRKKLELQRTDSSLNSSLGSNYCKLQITNLISLRLLLEGGRHFASLQGEGTEVAWISDQPLYQKLFWQNRMNLSRRHAHLLSGIRNLIIWLRRRGMRRDHKILSSERAFGIVSVSKVHESAAFAYAYLMQKRKLLTDNEEHQIKDSLESFKKGNAHDIKHLLKLLEPALKDIEEASTEHKKTGRRILVPVTLRARRRENLRKAALAKPKSIPAEESPDEEDLTTDPKTEATKPAPIKEAAVEHVGSEKKEDVESTKIEDVDSTETQDPESGKTDASETDNTTQTEATTTMIDEELGTGSSTPAFKLSRYDTAPTPRNTGKSRVIYSRARSRLSFKPPKPIFKETGRRSQELRSSPADFVEEQESSDALKPVLYQIPPKDLRSALLVSQTSQAAFWRYSLYKSPTGEKPLNHYCTRFDQAEQAAKLFLQEKVIGFDIEWEMKSSITHGSIKDNVSLIQIACDSRIALFHIALFVGDTIEKLMPPTLKRILESPAVIKAGVNIAGDFTRLRKCLGIEGQGLFELSHLYKLVKYSEKEPSKVNRTPLRLADQVQDVLYLPLAKGPVRTSAWSRRLTMEQVDYAATDAYAGFRLFQELEWARKAMKPTPPRPALWELNQPIVLGNGELAPIKKKIKSATDRIAATGTEASTLSPEEEQAISEEEEEARAEAEVDASDESGSQEPESAGDVEYEAADEWLDQWESKLPLEKKGKSIPTNIRAYALWHPQGLKLEEVAGAMRQPPLALTTVASYVLEVVKTEKLPCEPSRVQEAVEVIPAVARGRYRSLLQRIASEAGDHTT